MNAEQVTEETRASLVVAAQQGDRERSAVAERYERAVYATAFAGWVTTARPRK